MEELLNDLLIYVYKLYENEIDYMYDCLNNIIRELHRKKSLKRKKIKIKHFRVQTFLKKRKKNNRFLSKKKMINKPF